MISSRSRALICGYYGFGNSGDELILAAMLHELRRLRPGLAATVISGDPESTRTSHGVDAVHWQDVPAIAREVEDADLVLVGGGGLFQEYAGIDRDSLFTERHYALTFYSEPAILGALHGRPVMLYAVGVGPLLSEHGRRTVRAACDAARVITVRDEESARVIAALGVDPSRLRVTADPVFALPDADATPEPDGLAAAVPEGPGALVGVSVRHWDVGVASYFWEKELAAGLDAFLARHEARLLFVPFQRLSRAPENDAAVAERVRSLLRRPERAAVLPGDPDPRALKAVLGRCDLVVGMRLHSMILAAIGGVPGVALAYDPKVEAAMSQLGADPFVLRLPDIEARTVAARMDRALAEGPARREELAERVARLAAQARRDAAAAIELLDGGPVTVPLSPVLAEVTARAVTSRFETEAALRGEAAAREAAQAALESSLESRLAELRRAQADLERRGRELEQSGETLARKDEELRRRDAELATKDADLERAKGEVVRKDEELRRRDAELAARGAELERTKGALAARGAELERTKGALEARGADLERAKTEIARQADALRQLGDELAAESAELEQSEVEVARQDEELERSRAETDRLRAELAGARDELLRIHRSRHWKLATRYWRFLEAIGRLPASKG